MKSTHLVVAAAFCAALPLVATGDEPGPKPEALFDQLDKNKDGSIAGDEVGDEQKKLFERLVRRGDKDSDGKLTKDEFVQGFQQDDKQPKSGDERGERGERRGRGLDPDAMFQRLDKNGDGKLTIEELPDQARERMGAIFERLGKDELSKDEFRRVAESRRRRFEAGAGPEGDRPPRDGDDERPRRGLGRRGDGPGDDAGPEGDADKGPNGPFRRGRGMREGRALRVPKLVELLDANKDQKISKDELAKATEMFDKLDANKDGVLDLPELLGPPPGGRRDAGGPEGGPDEGRRRGFRGRAPRDGGPEEGGPGEGGPRDGGPGDGGPKEGGPDDKGPGPGDNPPPKKAEDDPRA
jgi:Ca2+-binding EF-hand superfamily protein